MTTAGIVIIAIFSVFIVGWITYSCMYSRPLVESVFISFLIGALLMLLSIAYDYEVITVNRIPPRLIFRPNNTELFVMHDTTTYHTYDARLIALPDSSIGICDHMQYTAIGIREYTETADYKFICNIKDIINEKR